MFQNINENILDGKYVKDRREKNKINIFANVFTIKNIPIYIIALMISMVGITGEISPFSISFLGACMSNAVPLLGIVIFSIHRQVRIAFGSVVKIQPFILSALLLISPDINIFIYLCQGSLRSNHRSWLFNVLLTHSLW